MTIWFVSRHEGAISWLAKQGLPVDRVVPHLDVSCVRAGDTVIGTLPAALAAEVCAAGALFVSLSLCVPHELRGKELSADDMERCGAQLKALHVTVFPLGD